jgi:hypothetical protein
MRVSRGLFSSWYILRSPCQACWRSLRATVKSPGCKKHVKEDLRRCSHDGKMHVSDDVYTPLSAFEMSLFPFRPDATMRSHLEEPSGFCTGYWEEKEIQMVFNFLHMPNQNNQEELFVWEVQPLVIDYLNCRSIMFWPSNHWSVARVLFLFLPNLLPSSLPGESDQPLLPLTTTGRCPRCSSTCIATALPCAGSRGECGVRDCRNEPLHSASPSTPSTLPPPRGPIPVTVYTIGCR